MYWLPEPCCRHCRRRRRRRRYSAAAALARRLASGTSGAPPPAMLRLQALLRGGSGACLGALAALQRRAAGLAPAAAGRPADILVVHPAASPRHSLAEALRLAESLAGAPSLPASCCVCAFFPLGAAVEARITAAVAPPAPTLLCPLRPPTPSRHRAGERVHRLRCPPPPPLPRHLFRARPGRRGGGAGWPWLLEHQHAALPASPAALSRRRPVMPRCLDAAAPAPLGFGAAHPAALPACLPAGAAAG